MPGCCPLTPPQAAPVLLRRPGLWLKRLRSPLPLRRQQLHHEQQQQQKKKTHRSAQARVWALRQLSVLRRLLNRPCARAHDCGRPRGATWPVHQALQLGRRGRRQPPQRRRVVPRPVHGPYSAVCLSCGRLRASAWGPCRPWAGAAAVLAAAAMQRRSPCRRRWCGTASAAGGVGELAGGKGQQGGWGRALC